MLSLFFLIYFIINKPIQFKQHLLCSLPRFRWPRQLSLAASAVIRVSSSKAIRVVLGSNKSTRVVWTLLTIRQKETSMNGDLEVCRRKNYCFLWYIWSGDVVFIYRRSFQCQFKLDGYKTNKWLFLLQATANKSNFGGSSKEI